MPERHSGTQGYVHKLISIPVLRLHCIGCDETEHITFGTRRIETALCIEVKTLS